MATPSAQGFLFEELVGTTLRSLFPALEAKGFKARLLTEQDIRDVFQEQSLNGVDHYFEVIDASGHTTLFLIQEKWKLITNQREVSQFLDCCARILSRLPAIKRQTVYRLWVTRSAPSANGEKSILEGGAYTIQCMTSPAFLAQMVGQFVCEVLGDRRMAIDMILGVPSILPDATPLEPEVLDQSKIAAGGLLAKKTVVHVMKD